MLKIVIILTTLALLSNGCSIKPRPENQQEITLITGGYGYEIGDIVLLDTEKEPELGDVVQYDANINNSYCMAFGPGIHLARIIGLPGDNVRFAESTYEANGYVVDLQRGVFLTSVIWGTDVHPDLTGMELAVPVNEFLADNVIGQECTGETDEHGSSLAFYRYTVKKEAINGVIVEKLGHDEEFAEREKQKVY